MSNQFKKEYERCWRIRDDAIYIDNPFIWDIVNYESDANIVFSNCNVSVSLPIATKELLFKIHIKSSTESISIHDKIKDIINGEFTKDGMGRYYFKSSDDSSIPTEDVDVTKKLFGLLQVLSRNKHIKKGTKLFISEPDRYLDSKHEVIFLNLINQLSANGVITVIKQSRY